VEVLQQGGCSELISLDLRDNTLSPEAEALLVRVCAGGSGGCRLTNSQVCDGQQQRRGTLGYTHAAVAHHRLRVCQADLAKKRKQLDIATGPLPAPEPEGGASSSGGKAGCGRGRGRGRGAGAAAAGRSDAAAPGSPQQQQQQIWSDQSLQEFAK
jgi:hypothetical protein